MTREEFNLSYQLLNQITDGSVRTHHALAPSGAVVMAHFLGDDTDAERYAILARLESLDPDQKSRVLEVLDLDGSAVVVTKFILDFESLQRWLGLDARAPADAAAPALTEPAVSPAAEPIAPTAAPGEFTQLFSVAGSSNFAAEQPIPTPTQDPTPPPPTPGPAAPTEPGEFTRLFQAPLPPPAPLHPSGVDAPGWTSFDDSSRPAQPTAELPPAAPSLPGLNLYSPRPAPPADAPPPAPPAPEPAAPPPAAPGDFTRIFGRASLPPDLAPPPVMPAAPLPRPAAPLFASPAPAATSPTSGPGEYTRIISAQTAAPAYREPPPAAVAVPAAETAPPARWPLVVGLLLVLVIALALAWYFALHST